MVSILLATYNGEKYIQQSIESILNQSFENLELLIGFNGTTDNSRQIITKYNDTRIKIFDYGSEKGKAKTLNKLLNQCKYDWIALQDDDDIWLRDKLEKQIKYIHEYDVIGTFIYYINEKNEKIGSPNLQCFDSKIKELSFFGDNQVANTSAIFKKSDALEVNGWQENLDGIEDFHFWLKLMKKNKKFINISEYLVMHRIHTSSNFNTKQYDIKSIL